MNTRRHLNRLIALCLFCIFALATSWPAIADTKASTADAKSSETAYVIGPEDVLKIFVWQQPDLSLTVPVRIDGKISLPLVNDIRAAGLTPMQLKAELESRLKKYIEEPTASVIVETINSLHIVVVGYVNTPGIYKVGRVISLLEAISYAGGLGQWANEKEIKVIRKEGKKEKIYICNYKDITDGSDLSQNISIFPGDIVIVP
jgi:polysaccharide export outer membrane protein